jgi:tetratricopeptide (TPR) repeat protein
MKVLVGLMTTALMVTACGTAPVKFASKKVDPVEVQRKYASQVESVFVGETKVEACPIQKVIDAEKSWKSLMAKANGCINKSQWSVVEAIGEKLSQVEPEAPWGAYYLSIAAENKGHTERAMWMVDLALKKASNIGVLKYQKGRILWKQQFYKEAIAEMQQAVELDKNIKDAHLFLGQVFLRELDFKKAQGYFETVLLLESRNHQALLGLASCYIELENSKEAISVIDRGISNFPKVLDFRLQEVYVYENLIKEPAVALEKYKQLQSLIANKKVDGTLPFDINAKIKNLEEVTQKTRQLASKKG